MTQKQPDKGDTYKPVTGNEKRRFGTRNEAAEIAGVHPRTVDTWLRPDKNGNVKLTTYRERGYHVRIDLDELDAFLATRAGRPGRSAA